MKYLVLILMLLTRSIHADKSDDLFDDWYNCKHDMVLYGIFPEVDEKRVLYLLKRGTNDALENIKMVDSKSDTTSSKSGLYELAASIQGTAFRQLTDYSRYEDCIYDLTKEKQVDDEWTEKYRRWQTAKEYEKFDLEQEKERPWWKLKPKPEKHCYYQGEDIQTKEEYLKTYPSRSERIERKLAGLHKKEYAKKVKPYLWIIEREKKYWELSKKYGQTFEDKDLADFALDIIKNEYEPMWRIK